MGVLMLVRHGQGSFGTTDYDVLSPMGQRQSRRVAGVLAGYGVAPTTLIHGGMRRQRETPNGFMEFLIAEAIEHLRARGVAEVSLNFAAFARLIRQPDGLAERVLARALAIGDSWFQIERLYRFNAKFFPRWEPRYFMYERRLGLPRAGIAALWLEGQLPKPKLFRRAPADA